MPEIKEIGHGLAGERTSKHFFFKIEEMTA